jgi:hypothetical protein
MEHGHSHKSLISCSIHVCALSQAFLVHYKSMMCIANVLLTQTVLCSSEYNACISIGTNTKQTTLLPTYMYNNLHTCTTNRKSVSYS